MPVCPVCECEEPGVECPVCGRRLPGEGGQDGQDEPIPRLEGIEATCAQALPILDPEPVAGFEPTSAAVAPAPLPAPLPAARGEGDGSDPAPWIDRTAWGAAAAVTYEPLDVERTAAAPDAGPGRDPFALPTCRYCRTAAAPGEVFCSRCGLKLPVQAAARPPEVEGPTRRCRWCGAAGPGEACPACGVRFPAGA